MNQSILNIVSDGRLLTSSQDPPGQRSVYVRPGDPESELYRLVTYERFPQHCPVNPGLLAAAGFLYTGYKDQVRCFSCGQSVENWLVGDDPVSARWHRQGCEFICGTDSSNIPISTSVSGRLRRNHGNHFSSSSRSSTARSELHEPQQQNVVDASSTEDQSQDSSGNSDAHQHQVRLHEAADLFPCLNPINPHMRNNEARIQTFRDQSRAWPAHRIRATPEQIAQAGLYYLGERDRVKCWYCNGGLQNWDRFDDPWFEHAKWFPTTMTWFIFLRHWIQNQGHLFGHVLVIAIYERLYSFRKDRCYLIKQIAATSPFPTMYRTPIADWMQRAVTARLLSCEFVLQKKGAEFVINVVERFPRLNRPPAINPVGPFAANLPQVVSVPRSSGLAMPENRTPGAPQVIDPREERRTLERRLDEEMTKSALVAEARLMGFSDENIRSAFLRRLQEHGSEFTSFVGMVESIIAVEETNHTSSFTASETDDDTSTSATAYPHESEASQSMRELDRLRQTRLCKICLGSKSSVVFLPCGHLASCVECSRNLEVCPICKSNIRETVHSYIV